MAILKCKMCGGDIELSADKTFGTCEYCGSTMTFPKVDDEQRAAAFNRGNHFRRIGEFDKALAVYERIVREDDTDAEAHWCCALCRFGIEYVEDPASYEYVPTCHRASFDSFLEDVDYLAAVEHSDGITRRQYQKDAARIAEVQRSILATSQNTEPYDVFICYKESDANGDRTRDSLLAQDIYYQLTEQGRKVFFARITLEDIAGAQYEPYIFAALNSAKVMIVVGTKPEHLSAVWVKNEWSRFLTMMKKDHSKLLLPCYRDMDPYDMPEQLSVLQSYDMSKIGFIQDLTRGIAKVLDAEKKQESVKETVVLQQSAVPANNTAPLLKRAFMFLEDGDWNSANEYCEKVLDIDPENAEAYLGKLMAEQRVRKQEQLKNCANPFDQSSNYQKAVRFGEESLAAELKEYVIFIKERNETARKDDIYFKAQKAMISAKSAWYTKAEADYKATAQQFHSIKGYKDADKLAEECLQLAEEARKNAIYREALDMSKKDDKVSLRGAASRFYSIKDWKDSAEKEAECKKRMDEIDRAQQKAAKRIKTISIIFVIAVVVVAVVAVTLILIKSVIIPNSKYNAALALMDAGKLDEAYSAFIELGDYKDASEKAGDIRLQKTKDQLKNIKVGSHINFGAYEQDNNTSNGKEDVEWLVLEIKDGKALVISKYALDCKQYNTSYAGVTWETCTLRMWLNNDFLGAAFSADEKSMIPAVTVSADKNPEYSTNPGKATQDQVFLLSIPEANKYFNSDSARQCKPTDYAVANGANVNSSNGNCRWWVRSPGRRQTYVALVNDDGDVYEGGNVVDYGSSAVRPALWIDLSL